MAYNILTANQSSVETSATSGSFYSQFASFTRDTTVSEHGNASLKVTVSLAQETQDGAVGPRDIPLSPSTAYTWQVRMYVPETTYIRRSGFFLMEHASPFRQIALMSDTTLGTYAAGWYTLTGSGTTASDWHPTTALFLRPARKSDDLSYDSTKAVYYDKMMVQDGLVASPWVLGGQDYNAVRITPDAVLAQSGFSNATTPNIAFIQDDPEDPDANSFS